MSVSQRKCQGDLQVTKLCEQLTAEEPTSSIPSAPYVVGAQEGEGLNSSDTRRIQLYLEKCLGPIGEKVGERPRERNECWVVSRVEGGPQSAASHRTRLALE